ncbi:putative Adenylate kinase 7 [Blattamonas nauphoetae]|uniref:Adenylate kinase 7 n=1 Tax=Blattamonas nauphoetae TaxID=2049346 RepID=A0ABQ9X6L2_9EUKA|nr:putative Adenylate kinase 7 [Blattamonas nauphoetae]
MKIFLSNIDLYLQKRVYNAICLRDKTKQHSFIATLSKPSIDRNRFLRVESFVSSDNEEEFKEALLNSDVIVFDIQNSLTDANIALDIISAATFYDDKRFICISTFLTWATTQKTFQPIEEEEAEEAEEGEEPIVKEPPKPIPIPFTETDRRKRQPHQAFNDHLTFEKMLLRLDGTQHGRLRTFVLNPGLLYGDGEDILEKWFKMAWYGVPDELPIFGDSGDNSVPTIHVFDMASIVYRVAMDLELKENLILCVDKARHTQKEIATALSRVLGTNKVRLTGTEDTRVDGGRVELKSGVTMPKMSEVDLEMPWLMVQQLVADVPTESKVLEQWETMRWHSGDIVANIWKVSREFRRRFNLNPHRILIHGPPGSGKSVLAKHLCEVYSLEHVNAKDVIEYWKNQPSSDKPLLPTLSDKVRATLTREGHHAISDKLFNRMIREYLIRRECRSAGYVLDGYPRCVVDAQELWLKGAEQEEGEEEEDAAPPEEEEEEEQEGKPKASKPVSLEEWEKEEAKGRKEKEKQDKERPAKLQMLVPKTAEEEEAERKAAAAKTGEEEEEEQAEEQGEAAEEEGEEADQEGPTLLSAILPERAILLDCTDNFIKARLKALGENEVKGTHNDEMGVERRLKTYRQTNNEDNNMKEWLEEKKVQVMEINMEEWKTEKLNDEGSWKSVREFVGLPRNFGVSDEDRRQEEEFKALIESQVKSSAQATEFSEEIQRKADNQLQHLKQKAQLEAIKQEEARMLAERSKGLNEFLKEYVMPVLTQGLKEVAVVRPEDPIDYLAEYLFRNTPDEDTETDPFSSG